MRSSHRTGKNTFFFLKSENVVEMITADKSRRQRPRLSCSFNLFLYLSAYHKYNLYIKT